MSLNLQIGGTYTFNTLAPAILGAVLENMYLNFACDFNTAMKYQNVQVTYQQIFPALPSGAPTSPTGVTWYQFTSESGQTIFIAEPWIDQTTLALVTGLNFTVNVTNATSDQKADMIKVFNILSINYSISD